MTPASTVEFLEQGEARTGRLGHALHLSAYPAVSTLVLHLDFDGFGRESELGDAQPFFTETKLVAQVIFHLSYHHTGRMWDESRSLRGREEI